jgi:hypothetical protein
VTGISTEEATMNGLESMIAYGGVAVAYAAALVLIAVRGRPGHRARMGRVSGPLSRPTGGGATRRQ